MGRYKSLIITASKRWPELLIIRTATSLGVSWYGIAILLLFLALIRGCQFPTSTCSECSERTIGLYIDFPYVLSSHMMSSSLFLLSLGASQNILCSKHQRYLDMAQVYPPIGLTHACVCMHVCVLLQGTRPKVLLIKQCIANECKRFNYLDWEWFWDKFWFWYYNFFFLGQPLFLLV